MLFPCKICGFSWILISFSYLRWECECVFPGQDITGITGCLPLVTRQQHHSMYGKGKPQPCSMVNCLLFLAVCLTGKTWPSTNTVGMVCSVVSKCKQIWHFSCTPIDSSLKLSSYCYLCFEVLCHRNCCVCYQYILTMQHYCNRSTSARGFVSWRELAATEWPAWLRNTSLIRSPVTDVVTTGLQQHWLVLRRTYFSSSSRSWTRPHSSCSVHRSERPHHSTPPTSALADRTREDPVQARCSCVQVSSRDSTIIPPWWASMHGWRRGPERPPLHFLTVAGCPL